ARSARPRAARPRGCRRAPPARASGTCRSRARPAAPAGAPPRSGARRPPPRPRGAGGARSALRGAPPAPRPAGPRSTASPGGRVPAAPRGAAPSPAPRPPRRAPRYGPRCTWVGSAEEIPDGRGDVLALLGAELREHGEREDRAARPLRLGERPLPVPEVAEALLQVERDRVVHRAADPALAEEADQVVAAPLEDADRVLVEDGLVAGEAHRRADALHTRERLVVE